MSAERSSTRTCEHCGAPAARSTSRFCEYCGKELPAFAPLVEGRGEDAESEVASEGVREPETVAEPISAEAATAEEPDPFGDVEARFASLREHPELAQMMAHVPPGSPFFGGTFMPALAAIFMGLAGFVVSGLFFNVCPPLGFIPLAIAGVLVVVLLRQARRNSTASKAPIVRSPALVVDERTEVAGGRQQSSAKTRHFVTLEFDDHARREVRTTHDTAGNVSRGDLGVAYLQHDYLVDFGRVAGI